MFRLVLVFCFLIILISINSLSFGSETALWFKILGHGLFMPLCGVIYFIKRDFQFSDIDKLVMLVSVIGSICDVVIFFGLNERGEFLQITAAIFLHLVFIIIFRKEGAFVFNIAKTNILKILIPFMFVFFFFGFVLLKILPNLLYFMVIIYAVEVTILAILGYFRPVSKNKYWFVAIGVSVLILKDFLYSYYFYVFKGNQHALYIPLYWTNAIGYFLVIYGIAINQNSYNQRYEKVSMKAVYQAVKNMFQLLINEITKFSISQVLLFYFGINRHKTPI